MAYSLTFRSDVRRVCTNCRMGLTGMATELLLQRRSRAFLRDAAITFSLRSCAREPQGEATLE